MIIYKEKLSIELEESVEKLKREIEQLEQLKKEILASSTYHLLDGKTQMIDKSEEIEIRSRQEHTNNVANIAKQIIGRIYDLCSIERISKTEVFKLNKLRAELYAEITALAHDLGHTPFGHCGEVALNEFMQSIKNKDEIDTILNNRRKYFGEQYEEEQGHTKGFEGKLSFEHNEQSAIEFCKIVEQSQNEFDEVNMKKIVAGILAHSISRVPEVPNDLIAQIVRQTDKIEYRNKDYEELMKYVKFNSQEEELKKYQAIPIRKRIKQIIIDISNEAIEKGRIDDDNDALKDCKKLRKKYENIIYFLGPDGKRGLIIGENRERQQVIYKKLLDYYYNNPERIPTKSMAYTNPIGDSKENKRVISFDTTRSFKETSVERVIRYVNTFTNAKCEQAYLRLIRLRATKGEGYGIEPITEVEIEERKRVQIEEQIAKMRAKEIYKGIESHTYQEYLNILQAKNIRFVENDITDEAKEAIEKNRIKHQKENDEDRRFLECVADADNKRLDLEIVKERFKKANRTDNEGR